VLSPSARSCLSAPKAASADAIAFVQKLEAAVIAEKAAREKRLAEVRKREAERRQEADRQKAAVERAKAESQLRE
jgi:Trk K+ transport system NAD-binding subunit